MGEPARIAVVDDHPIYREGLARSLGDLPGIVICGEGATADDAVRIAAEASPDLILLDLSMPGGGHVALERIHASRPSTKILVITASENDDDVFRALGSGAAGYVLKGVGAQDLAHIVRSTLAGESYVSPSLAARILRRMKASEGQSVARDHSFEDRLAGLTAREEEILRLVAKGNSNKEIARRIDVQEKTIKNHMTRILKKLQARSRLEAAMILRDASPGR